MADSAIDVELIAGDWVASEYFGWTEFEVDGESGALTVTTYSISPYTLETLRDDPAGVISREPAVASQIRAQPATCRGRQIGQLIQHMATTVEQRIQITSRTGRTLY